MTTWLKACHKSLLKFQGDWTQAVSNKTFFRSMSCSNHNGAVKPRVMIVHISQWIVRQNFLTHPLLNNIFCDRRPPSPCRIPNVFLPTLPIPQPPYPTLMNIALNLVSFLLLNSKDIQSRKVTSHDFSDNIFHHVPTALLRLISPIRASRASLTFCIITNSFVCYFYTRPVVSPSNNE